jgi:hypothetical protein
LKLGTGQIVVLKGVCFLVAALLTPLSTLVAACAVQAYWPSGIALFSASLAGIMQAALTLPAYLDGGVRKYQQEMPK